jgi:hypothetical protein
MLAKTVEVVEEKTVVKGLRVPFSANSMKVPSWLFR